MLLSHPSKCCAFENYYIGQVITLNVLPDHCDPSGSVISVRIRELHTRTLSCTMVVDILEEQPPLVATGVAFLKLFDRRFSDGLRRNNNIEPWTKDREQAYIESVESGAVDRFVNNLRNVDYFQEDTGKDWNDAENEAFLAYKLVCLYNAEISVYDVLREHQGRHIPKLFAAVQVELATRSDTLNRDEVRDFAPFQVKGILLDYLKSCNMLQIGDNFPRSSWQGIVDQAIAIVRIFDHHNILNRDVDPRNFLVCKGQEECTDQDPHVYMIDFGLCRFRGPGVSDAQWGRDKHNTDEEGAIGLRMKKLLDMEHGYELLYEDSRKYGEWADTDENSIGDGMTIEVRPGVYMSYPAPSKNAQ